MLLDVGEGVEEDPIASYEWFLKAAKAEVRVSQINVAMCLQRCVPHGVPNLEEAFFWFQESTKPLRHEEEKSDLQKTQSCL